MTEEEKIYGPRPKVVNYGREGDSLKVRVDGVGVTIEGHTSKGLGFIAHLSLDECLELDAALQHAMFYQIDSRGAVKS